MLRLSENVLESAATLLKRLDRYHFSSLLELAYYKISSIGVEDIFEFSNKCGWVCENNNQPVLTDRGAFLLELQNENCESDMKRHMLQDYVLRVFPIWANRIPYGRREAVIFMSEDEKACFYETDLLSDHLDASIVDWWDTVADKIRMHSQQKKNSIGRLGEKSTIEYEKGRTDSEPNWMSVESNLIGYDIRSRMSKDDSSILLIEVKSSSSPLSEANFHVTSNEWYVASTSLAYVFHLWCFWRGKKLLATISPDEVQPYIPTNNLKGEWESAKIPFSCFENKFVEIS